MIQRYYQYYAGWPTKLQAKTHPVDGNFLCYTKHHPVGVCGQIIPWNFPLVMFAWKIAPVLASGCTTVIKPSEHTPLAALKIVECMQHAGLPDGVVNVLTGYGADCGSAISRHPDIRKIAFTGSVATGQTIIKEASQTMKRTSMELGGKAPLIVFDDADLAQVLRSIYVGSFINSG